MKESKKELLFLYLILDDNLAAAGWHTDYKSWVHLLSEASSEVAFTKMLARLVHLSANRVTVTNVFRIRPFKMTWHSTD